MHNSPIWHPMTQHAIFPRSIHVDHAKGAYLYTSDGKRIIDGISSWWVNTHGHAHPKIVQAIQNQVEKLEQVIFAGFSHDPAEQLAHSLLEKTQDRLSYVFFSDSGSTAIEVALKMAIGFFEHNGAPRKKIVALEGGYHGDTFGTMSTGSRGVFNKIYEPFLFDVEHIVFPDKQENKEEECIESFKSLVSKGDVAALILEPLMQGAAGMRIYSESVLKELENLCREHGVLLIADEVMTGFGRLGSFFACDQAQVVPDILCLSKGITGGFLPMGVTMASTEIYNAFYDQDRSKTFFHSTSFTGNALACAAANASMDIWEQEPVLERIKTISDLQQRAAQTFKKQDDIVKNVRQKGTILALDLQDIGKDGVEGYLSDLGPYLYRFFLNKDVLLRPIGNCVYVLPPYCVTKEDMEEIYECIEAALDSIRHERGERAA